MKIPIDGIQAFVEVADLGSFSRAATRLAITQTALTRRIQRLESFVGLRLLDRTTRSVSLTPMGSDFLPMARRLVDDLVFGLDKLRNLSRFARGEVTVATLQSVAVQHIPQAIRRYVELHPLNDVKVIERSGAHVTEAVRQGQVDFGIHIIQATDSDLEEETLVHSPFVLVCHQKNPVARRRSLRWTELESCKLITLGGASGNRRVVEEQLVRSGLGSGGRIVVESILSALALLRLDLGAAILPSMVSSLEGDLVSIPLIEPVLQRSIGLVKRRNATLTPAAAAFYDVVRTSFSECAH